MAAFALKVELDGDVRRSRCWPEDGAEPSFESLRVAVLALFELDPAEGLSLQCLDDEGNSCAVTECTFGDAVRAAEKSGRFRLVVTRTSCHVEAVESDTDSWVDIAEAPNEASTGEPPSPPQSIADLDVEQDLNAEHNPPPGESTGASDRFVEGCGRFLGNVACDFETASNDMRAAFQPGVDGEADQPPLREISAALVGVVVAARLVPVRLTRLAADGAAAVAGTEVVLPTAGENDTEGEPPSEMTLPSLEEVEQNTEPPRAAVDEIRSVLLQAKREFSVLHDDARHFVEDVPAPEGAGEELCHFVGQVKHDFCQAHDDVQNAVRDLVGAGKALCRAPPTRGKCVFSALAGGIAGTLVAVTLVPFRGARLAAAKLAAEPTAAAPAPSVGTEDAADAQEDEAPHVELNDAGAVSEGDGDWTHA